MSTAVLVTMLSLSAGLYVRGSLRVWRRAGLGRGIRGWEALAFAAGWLTVLVALAPPIDRLAEHLQSAHMVQHELLMLVAAPLLALGRPLVAMLMALPTALAARVSRWSRILSPGPLIAWLVVGVVIWIWHVPASYDLAARSPVVHGLEHVSFLGSATLFAWTLLRGPGARARFGLAALYVFTTALHTGLLGALLLFARRPWFATYRLTAPRFGIDPLEDQQLAGLIMWIPAGVLLAAAALTLVAFWFRDVERRQRRITTGHRGTGLCLLVLGCISTLLTGCTGERGPAVTLTGGDPDRGREAMRRYGCWTCHTIPGVAGANATVGPPLSGLASRAYVAGRPNTPEHLVHWVRHPQELRRPTPMPDLGVTENDGRDIVAFLYTLR
jgi:cytochrome c oxidase assembly factor CtaG